jgi:hypothetical protein
MSLIQLKHYKKLGYPATSKKTMPLFPDNIDTISQNVVTFRPLDKRKPDILIKKMTAVERFLDYSSSDILFYGVQTDSPLAPLILWDAAHALPVGKTITIIEDVASSNYLDKEYFIGSFSVERVENRAVYTKIAPLVAEKDSGLDDWTFGIPVGPEDATLLNKVVERILEIDAPRKEIILCGRPGENFKYFDQVRIVGEDIKAPPVHITAKKNRIAQEAKYSNLCIIHDRVFLPKNFMNAIRKFGDFYPLTAFQSIFFDDKYNLVPRRYSDFNISNKLSFQSVKSLMRDNNVTDSSSFSSNVFAITEQAGFFYANPLRFSEYTYPTGSLYLCKRQTWLLIPQDERLYWTEFEDVEQAFRASQKGIPSRVNPFSMTQSLISRPLLSVSGGINYEKMNGSTALYKSIFEKFSLKRKPLIKVSYTDEMTKTHNFIKQYIKRDNISSKYIMTSPHRIKQITDIIYQLKVRVQKKSLTKLALDYEKQILFDQLPYGWVEDFCNNFLESKEKGIVFILDDNKLLRNHVSQRIKGEIFFDSLNDYFQKATFYIYVGSFISAILLRLQKRKAFYFQRNIFQLYKDILNTTPWKDKK